MTEMSPPTEPNPPCKQCGKPVPAESPLGHCPACLCRVALLGGVEEEVFGEGIAGPWAVLGDCELYEEIGRGGMGTVYRARHTLLGRDLAVKVLRGGSFAGGEARERFQEEARNAARLGHPGIVTVHDFGEDHGVCWISMELVAGRNLDDATRQHPMEGRAAAECVRLIAGAVEHAHGAGVLHRDLKPSNILLDANGQPHVADFGIARRVEGGLHLTRTGQMLGSPGFTAPEQALHGLADARTDVYGLGAVLYSILTGRPPFQGPTAESVLVQLRDADPLPPRQLNPAVPKDLETITLKCLAREPARRYESAGEVAEELSRYLEGRGIRARPVSTAERVWRWGRRHPAVAALLLLLGLSIAAALVISDRARRRESDAAVLARASAYRSDVRLASVELPLGHSPAYDRLCAQSVTGREGWELRHLAQMLARPLWQFDAVPRETIYSGVFSPDGRHFSAGGSHGEVWVWETASRKLERTIPAHAAAVGGVAWSPDGTRLASAGADSAARVWNVATGELVREFKAERDLWVVAWSPEGAMLAVGGFADELALWDVVSGTKVATFPALGGVGGACWSQRGRIAAFRNAEPEGLQLLDASLNPVGPTRTEIRAFAWRAGDRLAAHSLRDGGLRVVDAEDDFAVVWEGRSGRGEPAVMCLSENRLLTADRDGVIQVWDWKAGRLLRSMSAHEGRVENLDSRAGLILSSGLDGSLKLWAMPEGPAASRELDAAGPVLSLQWAGAGLRAMVMPEAAVAGARARFLTWTDLANKKPAISVPLTGYGAWSPDGEVIAVVHPEGQVAWHCRDGVKTGENETGGKDILHALWSPQGDRLWISNPEHPEGPSLIWDVKNGRRVCGIPASPVQHPRTEKLPPCAWSPDGKSLVMSAGGIHYDAVSGALLPGWPQEDHGLNAPGRITAWAWHPSGRIVAAGRESGKVELRDAGTGRLLLARRVHSGAVTALHWHPYEERLASCGRDGSVRVLDSDTLDDLIVFTDHNAEVTAVAWSVDGETLATGGMDGHVFLRESRPAPAHGSDRTR